MRFYGYVGYALQKEVSPNDWQDVLEEREAYGDVLENIRRWTETQYLNDDLRTQNRLSLVCTPFMLKNTSKMRYVRWLDTKWKVVSVQMKRPRLIVTLGGVYNE